MALPRGQKKRAIGVGPKVNPNPRPPNEPRARARFEASKVHQLQKRIHQRRLEAQKKKQQQQTKKPTTATPTPGQPTFAPPTDPRDEQYWTDYAQLNFNKDLALRQYGEQDVADRTAYEQQLLARTQDEPLETQRMREGANVGGMIYSTAHQEDLGQLGKEQFLQRDEINTAYRDAVTQRALDTERTQGQYNIDMLGISADARARATQAELSRPGPTPPPAQYGPPPSQKKKKPYPIPHQQDINRIQAAQKALKNRAERLQKRRSSSQGTKTKKRITTRLHKVQKKRKYLSQF